MASFAYYNENDKFAAAWLRNLMEAGHIASGVVDDRSIEDVKSEELKEFKQVHLFAGIGGWSLAARMAKWSDERQLWTGSCPCQPFSYAGKKQATNDKRHLWPHMFRLIAECRPDIVVGEQVASSHALSWLDGVFSDLEGQNYACWAADICAASVGAPHIRQRLWWVSMSSKWMADSNQLRRKGQDASRIHERRSTSCSEESENVESQGSFGNNADRCSAYDYWSRYDVAEFTDGKKRKIESGTFPLAHGVSGRMGKLRAYGNAIVPQVAAEVLKAIHSP
jgi:DNA (cytosine-5)-methyltransferase 1